MKSIRGPGAGLLKVLQYAQFLEHDWRYTREQAIALAILATDYQRNSERFKGGAQ